MCWTVRTSWGYSSRITPPAQSFTLSFPVCFLSASSFLRLPLSDLGGPLSSCPKPAHFSCLLPCSFLKACQSSFRGLSGVAGESAPPFISSPIVLPSSRAPLLQRRPPTPPSISPAEHSSSFSGERPNEWVGTEWNVEERRRRKSGRAGEEDRERGGEWLMNLEKGP